MSIVKTMLWPNAVEETACTTTVTKIIIPNAGIYINTHQMNTALSHKDSCFGKCRQLHTQLESITNARIHTHTAQPSKL